MILSSGTWTPVVWDATLSDAESQTYTHQYGSWTRVGSHVYITGNVELLSLGTLDGGNQMRIGGLPFPSSTLDNTDGSICMGVANQLDGFNTANDYFTGVVLPDTSHINVWKWETNTGVSVLLLSTLSANGLVVFEGHYITQSRPELGLPDLSVLSYATETITPALTKVEDLFIPDDGNTMYVSPELDGVFAMDLSTAWDVSTATWDYDTAIAAGTFTIGVWYVIETVGTTSFTAIGATANTVGLTFQATGVGSGTGTAGPNNMYDAIAEVDKIRCLWFSPDGENMVCSNANAIMVKYDLSVAWDLTSATFTAGQTFTLSGNSTGITMSPDGKYLFTVGNNQDTVRRVSFSTPWDFSTYSEDTIEVYDHSIEDAVDKNLAFSDDGFNMFIGGQEANSTIYVYSLAAAWDLRSGVLYGGSVRTLNVNAEAATVRGLAVKQDLTKIVVLAGGDIYGYE